MLIRWLSNIFQGARVTLGSGLVIYIEPRFAFLGANSKIIIIIIITNQPTS